MTSVCQCCSWPDLLVYLTKDTKPRVYSYISANPRPQPLLRESSGHMHMHTSEGTHQVAWTHKPRREGNNVGEQTPIGSANGQSVRSAIRKASYAAFLGVNRIPLKYTFQRFVHSLYVWPIPASDHVPRRRLRLWGQQNHTSLQK